MKHWIKFLILDVLLLVLIGCEYREQVRQDVQAEDREVMESVIQEEEMNQETGKKIAITFDDGPCSYLTVCGSVTCKRRFFCWGRISENIRILCERCMKTAI